MVDVGLDATLPDGFTLFCGPRAKQPEFQHLATAMARVTCRLNRFQQTVKTIGHHTLTDHGVEGAKQDAEPSLEIAEF
jgi:hypothetical protein